MPGAPDNMSIFNPESSEIHIKFNSSEKNLALIIEFSLNVDPISLGLGKFSFLGDIFLIYEGNKSLISLNFPSLCVPITILSIFFIKDWNFSIYLPYIICMTEEENNLNPKKKEDDHRKVKQNEVNNKVQNLKTENKTDEEKIKTLEEKLIRTLAEMENQRRRFEKEKEEAFEFGGFYFAKETLALIDNLDRAKISISNDEIFKKNKDLPKILKNLEIVQKDLVSIFKKNGIEQIECLNKKFDPNFHQAMLEIEDINKEPGIVIQEIQKGFTMKGRLLRPSLVGVAKTKTKDDESKKDKDHNKINKKNEENKEKTDNKI